MVGQSTKILAGRCNAPRRILHLILYLMEALDCYSPSVVKMINPVAEHVPTISEQSSSRACHSACGSGGGDAGAVFLFDDQRSGLLHAVPVCAVEYAHASVGGGSGLGTAQVHRWTTDVTHGEGEHADTT